MWEHQPTEGVPRCGSVNELIGHVGRGQISRNEVDTASECATLLGNVLRIVRSAPEPDAFVVRLPVADSQIPTILGKAQCEARSDRLAPTDTGDQYGPALVRHCSPPEMSCNSNGVRSLQMEASL